MDFIFVCLLLVCIEGSVHIADISQRACRIHQGARCSCLEPGGWT